MRIFRKKLQQKTSLPPWKPTSLHFLGLVKPDISRYIYKGHGEGALKTPAILFMGLVSPLQVESFHWRCLTCGRRRCRFSLNFFCWGCLPRRKTPKTGLKLETTNKPYLGGGDFKDFWNFHPENFGENDFHFDLFSFSDGLVKNHQPENLNPWVLLVGPHVYTVASSFHRILGVHTRRSTPKFKVSGHQCVKKSLIQTTKWARSK